MRHDKEHERLIRFNQGACQALIEALQYREGMFSGAPGEADRSDLLHMRQLKSHLLLLLAGLHPDTNHQIDLSLRELESFVEGNYTPAPEEV